MAERTDILFDDDGDLMVSGGDFASGSSDFQHVKEILLAGPGEYKQEPLIGASIRDAQNGSLDGELMKRIRINLESDGYDLNTLSQDENGINIDFEVL
jgi:hypothetical protein